MSFTLTPPIVINGNIGISVIQIGSMESPEILAINMQGWSALNFVAHWLKEVNCLLNGSRNKCCIVCGLNNVENELIMPSEWWILDAAINGIRFRYQVVSINALANINRWRDPDMWWTCIDNISSEMGDNNISKWMASLDDMERWREQYRTLIKACDMVINDQL